MATLTHNVIFVILITGILPTLLWLLFWLNKDRFQPEPRGLIFLTFIAGALSVFITLPFEGLVRATGLIGTERIFIYAAIEELVKFFIVFFIGFNSSYLDEPIDYAIYLITGALGFAMMENLIFLMEPSLQSEIPFIIETGILRFLGATILHSVLAATLGIILGFVFYKSAQTRTLFTVIGLAIVMILHTLFNSFIIRYVEINGWLTFAILWIVALIITGLLQAVRRVHH